MRYSFFLFFLCFSYSALQAQNKLSSDNKKALRFYEQSDGLLSARNYQGVLEVLTKACSEDPTFVEAFQRLGDVYRMMKSDDKARENYLKVIEMNPSLVQSNYFYLGEIDLKNGRYEEAKTYLEKFMNYADKSPQLVPLTAKLLSDCAFALQALKNPSPFNPLNLGERVNTPADEYLPSLTADGQHLVYTRKENKNEDFYESVLIDGQWKSSNALPGQINTPQWNEGAESISADGQTLLFTICNAPGGFGRCDIYMARLEGSSWGKPQNLGSKINTNAWESQPCLAPDGRTLYFASDRKGGLGKIDIWKAYLKDDGTWTDPVNLGPKINTGQDEQSPFIHHDNETLYFSSNGWPGMGGGDIYISRKEPSGQWGDAENVGYPINTYNEDFALVVTGKGDKGYFSSNATGGFGGHDLYSFDIPQHIKPKPLTFVKGTVEHAKTKQKLDADVEVLNLKTGETVYRAVSNAETGEFFASLPKGQQYVLNVSKDGFLFYSDHFSTDGANDQGILPVTAILKAIAVGEKMVLRNIFFETNSFKLNPESEVELKKVIAFMKRNPRIAIEISGHTDDVGTDESNQILSENRAKVVYGFLIRAGAKYEGLTFKGFGKTEPIDDNKTEAGRANNRRTELKIVKIN